MNLARDNMIDGQFLPNKLTDENVINAFRSVDRESLLPSALKLNAYCDDLPKLVCKNHVRYELSSMGMMRLLQTAAIDPHERVLVIGDPTGYLTFLASYLAQQVTTLEQHPIWYKKAADNVYKTSPHNVTLFNGPYHMGVPTQAPFDCILSGGCLDIPMAKLISQLKSKGRIYSFDPIIKRQYYQLSHLFCVQKIEKAITKKIMLETLAPNLDGYTPSVSSPVEFAL